MADYNYYCPDPQFRTYHSDRGIPLVFNLKLQGTQKPILTVENYMKWYSLFLVMPNEEVKIVDMNEYIEMGFDVGDHVWNPEHVVTYAFKKGYEVCPMSLDMLVGRWVQEHDNVDYSAPYEGGSRD